jgi:casein kinase II subunit beta
MLSPPKSGPTEMGNAGGTGKEAETRGGRRRGREETELSVEGRAGETISTASVATKADRYRPRIYGFQLKETAKLQSWKEAARDR